MKVRGMKMLEVIGMSVEDCIEIEKAGADRIELVAALSEGGLTPTKGMIEQCFEAVSIPIRVMIRPHSRNFHYSAYDLEVMKADIEDVKQIGCEGIVIGALDENGHIHQKMLEELLKVSGELNVTFHRAFDELADLEKGLDILLQYPNIKTILTSGGSAGKIEDHVAILRKLVQKADQRMEILLGGGVHAENIHQLIRETGSNSVHIGSMARENKRLDAEISIANIQNIVNGMYTSRR